MKRLICAVASLAVLACTDAPLAGGAGHARVYLTDDPFPFGSIAAVNVYVAKIEASASTDTTGLPPAAWVTIATPERTFNLLDFQGGSSTLLGEVDLPADRYAAVRVVINTGRSSVVRTDGSEAVVHWPVSGNLALYALVEEPLAVTSAGAQIIVDFDVGRTFVSDLSGGFYFVPWIRAVDEAATGRIVGTVTATGIEGDTLPLANAVVSIYRIADDPPPVAWLRANLAFATGRSDAQGRYAIAFVPAGLYEVIATDPAFPQRYGANYNAQVSVGAETRADILTFVDTTTGSGGGVDSTGVDSTGVDSTGAPSGPVATVTITPLTQTISVGDSAGAMAMTYNAQSQLLTGRTVTWTVSDSTVVTVTQAAYSWILLRARKSGTATLTATSEGVSGSATVTVR
jgi:hypothetical protein